MMPTATFKRPADCLAARPVAVPREMRFRPDFRAT